MYEVDYTFSFGHESFIKLFSNFCMRATPEYLLEIPDGMRPLIKLRADPIGTVLNSRTTTLHKCEAVPKRARI